MMGRTERPRADQPPALQRPGDRGDHRHLQRLGRRQFGQYTGQARRHQRLARARRSRHQQVVAARRRDLERALRRLLPLHLREVGGAERRIDLRQHRRGQDGGAAEMVEQAEQVGRREHLDIARPRRLRPLRGGADEPALDAARVQRGEQHTGRGRDAAVEAELADDDIGAQRLGIDHPHRAEQRERDRQVVVRALLGQVGGREVDGDPFGREREADRGQRGAHPLAAFGDRLVGQADDGEAGDAGRDLALHLDGARVEPEIGDGGNDRDHKPPKSRAHPSDVPALFPTPS